MGSNIFLGISHCYVIKIVDINCPMLFEIEYHGLLERHALSGKDYVSNFLSKRKKKCKTIIKYSEYIATFAILEKPEVLEDEIFKVLESSF